MQETSDRLHAEGMAQIAAAATPAELEEVRVALLGRKGRLTVLLRGLGDASPAFRICSPCSGET